MGRKIARVVTVILVALFLLGLLITAFGPSLIEIISNKTGLIVFDRNGTVTGVEYMFDGPLRGTLIEADIIDPEYTRYSILRYAHTNGDLEILYPDDYVFYTIDGISYIHRPQDYEHPQITFDLKDKTYTISDNGKYVQITRQGGWWPFKETQKVCPLTTPSYFYSPISIDGMEGYAVLLIDTDKVVGASGTIKVYLQKEDSWEQAELVFPDGTTASALEGYVRRRYIFDGPEDETVGNMELCMLSASDPSIAILYRTIYSENGLQLEEIQSFPAEWLKDWKF